MLMLVTCVTNIIHRLIGIHCILTRVIDLDLCVGYSVVVFGSLCLCLCFCLSIIPVITTFVVHKRIRLHYARESRSEHLSFLLLETRQQDEDATKAAD